MANEERHGLEPSPQTIKYLREGHQTGEIYAKSFNHNTINFNNPVPSPYFPANEINEDISVTQMPVVSITRESKDVIFYYPEERTNHITATEHDYYDAEGNHIMTKMIDMHATGVTADGDRQVLGLGTDVTGKELSNENIERYTNQIHNGNNFNSLINEITNVEYAREIGGQEDLHVKPYNYNQFNRNV
ncbi:hypothetical protein C1646_700390 [Rhizophagus diaphanus]|nr:hypothetical protein C1646_700390 [Rhizophagus diaphanus] [Rhizophagus sp. MUCL 43196]